MLRAAYEVDIRAVAAHLHGARLHRRGLGVSVRRKDAHGQHAGGTCKLRLIPLDARLPLKREHPVDARRAARHRLDADRVAAVEEIDERHWCVRRRRRLARRCRQQLHGPVGQCAEDRGTDLRIFERGVAAELSGSIGNEEMIRRREGSHGDVPISPATKCDGERVGLLGRDLRVGESLQDEHGLRHGARDDDGIVRQPIAQPWRRLARRVELGRDRGENGVALFR